MIRFPDFAPQDPAAHRDYTLNWQTWLGPNERIVSATVSRSDPALMVDDPPQISSDGKKVTVWAWAGVAGARYVATIHVVTDNVPPREEDGELPVTVADL